ncbi:MAG TPA: putative Ig domain-containing protein [Xanthomonadaceae bacterium]|nr:putative Ig domain-containing protein [Xanthomonadaceae bacterium]
MCARHGSVRSRASPRPGIDPGTGLIDGSPQSGTSTGSPYAVTVTASDPDGAGATQQFDIAVLSAGPADGPVFSDGFED